jgi:riboflavin synthase
MFTGIINAIGTIEAAHKQGDLRVVVSCTWKDLRIGESVAVSGACLTVVDAAHASFDVSAETLARTTSRWNVGDKVNLERALKMGDALDGHMVTGHVDGIAKIISIQPDGDSHTLLLEAPAPFSRFIAEKGSVTLDGISLTVNKVEGAKFWVNIIPHTWAATTLHERKAGDMLNLEIDMIARYVARLMAK